MEVKKINKKELDAFVLAQKQGQFLQSYDWGEFQIKAGNHMCRLGLFDDNKKLIQAISMVRKRLIAGLQYLYAPRVDIDLGAGRLSALLGGIQKEAVKNGIIFLRFEPNKSFHPDNKDFFVKKTIDVQPSRTIVLNISQAEDELLAKMHQKIRYNIRLAEKKGVRAKEIGKENFDEFWRIMEATKERDRFRLHAKEYYRKMLDIEYIRLLGAEYNNEIIAANIISIFGDTATYIHGASGNEHRNAMAPHLLQWATIKLAKEKGCKYYDLYGIDENKWPGVTRFKKGFGGEEIVYPGAYDIVFNPIWYNIYSIARKIRRNI